MKQLKLKIDSHCASCAVNINRALTELGCQSVQTNPVLKLVKLSYDENKLTQTQIEKALADIGYAVIKN